MLKKISMAAVAVSISATSSMAATNITWWHGMGGRNGEVINEVSQKFNEAQKECALTPVSKGSYEEALASGIAAFRSGEQPNILQVFDAGAATIINAKGAVIPAEDLINKAGYKFDREAFINGVRYFYAAADGKFVGMPFNTSAPIMYVNDEALKKAGVEAPKTWEDFEKVAPKLKEAGYIPLVQSQLTWQFTENFFSRNNIQFATNNNGYDSVTETKLKVTDPNLVMMFDKLKDWKDKGLFAYYGAGWNDNQKPFEEGKVALWIGSSGSFGGLQKTASMPFSATFLPYWGSIKGAGTNSFIGGAALFAMSGKSEAENKCVADFFQFLTSPEIQVFYHKATGYVAITTAAYEKAKAEGFYKEKPAAEVGIQQLSLPSGEWSKGYRLGFYPQIRSIMEREYNRIFSGEVTPKDAFDIIEKEGNDLLARFAKTAG
ncbi:MULTISPECIES: extracellular solute-binding protein [Rhizobium/Agrobacterium group]|uniref:extracellular solute-binding protein n=1 Tax=Rhizobium/Agrobacterium group TaxID=227290 RepID=UPI0003F1E5BF|nr:MULTISPECIES: extracellular solute-binding protein [Rhizobium/Agrobacterium group]AHK00201.1 glycerol-3-phosphate ABC transporter, periplasmic glycerol-3-phosphate-binding protein [Agrobacterium tumefaciens LBA4213 (Ach5)]AKC06063.1 sn-glycerol 3-phosphate transport system substrate-binding protein [Agrobacterium tumefaciens]AYM17616.1 sn-glycerol 3-phosphate transport system substrate-binding protein [Agrobacterium tumefaciens]AYM68915.1 sn-glycerol 3-phosphate transport system substrate-bi